MEFNTVLICGDRNWDDQELVDKVVFTLKRRYGIDTVVEGEANGADTQGRLAGEKYGLIIDPYEADWRIGRGGGVVRNATQLREGKPDICCAFHDDLPNSSGTLDMVKKAASSPRNIPVVIISHDKKGEKPYVWKWYAGRIRDFTIDPIGE